LIERRLFDRFGAYDERCLRCQDLEFFLRVFDKAPVGNLEDVLVDYRSDRKPTYSYWRENARFRRYAVAVAEAKLSGETSPTLARFESVPSRWSNSAVDAVSYVRDRWRRSANGIVELT
jgi:hypothetical protein